MSDEFDIHEYRAKRNRELERENAMLLEQYDVALTLLACVLNMCNKAGYPWQLVLDAAIELEGVDPGRMARVT